MFLERLRSNIISYPDRVVLRSAGCPQGYTYKQLDEASGRVCRYLKDHNIGREDYVMILMPREVSAYIAVIGVWKCRAAMVLIEEDHPSERVSYIWDDLNCRLVITKAVFEAMMQCDPCTDYEMPDIHDACYAAYTSGTTGRPKGIIHEFGKLDTFDYDYGLKPAPLDGAGSFAVITPLNFGPSIRNAVTALLHGKCLYIVPRDVVRNPGLLLKYLDDNRIDETSVTASFFKAYSFVSKYMRNVFVHSEPCTGIYADAVNVINLYTMSEVVFPICSFRIDKPYDNVPLGYPNKDIKVKLINSRGEEAKPYEVGEIVVEDIFTRGYIGLSDNNSKAFIDGFFHTGDLAYRDNDGMIYLRGRKDDIIKINGNRIEPFEIEEAIRRTLSINNVLVKGFADNRRSVIAAYILRDELDLCNLSDAEGDLIYTAQEMKDKLRDMIPDYMIPACYIVLESFPVNANGKLSRSDLPEPKTEDYRKHYTPPSDDTEAYFCSLFEKALRLDRVGVNDDFYQIGGDSLSAMNLIFLCDRYELTAAELYDFRTPANLSRNIKEADEYTDLDARNILALHRPQALLPEQQATYEGQVEFPDFLLNNLTRFMKLKAGIDIERFREAVDKVLIKHPVFSSVLIDDKGTVRLSYQPELFTSTPVVSVSREKLQEIYADPCRPFRMDGQLLYRRVVYRCGDEVYFFLEIHHLITDGTSLRLLFDEIEECYHRIDAAIPSDYLFLLLQRSAEDREKTAVAPERIREIYKADGFLKREYNSIRTDREISDLKPEKYQRIIDIDKALIKESAIYRKYSGNIFFMTCFLKTIADYNVLRKAFAFWVYSGREHRLEQSAHGMLIRTLPISLELEPDFSMTDYMDMIKAEVNRQIACKIPFISAVTDDFMLTPYFIYQNDVLYLPGHRSLFEESIELPSGSMAFEFHLIDNTEDASISALVKYSAGCYDTKSIEEFCTLFERNIFKAIENT